MRTGKTKHESFVDKTSQRCQTDVFIIKYIGMLWNLRYNKMLLLNISKHNIAVIHTRQLMKQWQYLKLGHVHNFFCFQNSWELHFLVGFRLFHQPTTCRLGTRLQGNLAMVRHSIFLLESCNWLINLNSLTRYQSVWL